MPLDTVLNRQALGTFRATLNAWVAQLNTNTADIVTNTADIATNTADIATNTANIATNTSNIGTNTSNIATNTADIATNVADIALRQLSNSESTLVYAYRVTASTTAITDTDVNGIIDITNVAGTDVQVPATAGLPSFAIGTSVIIMNNKNSSNLVTITNTGSSTEASSLTIAVGTSAEIVMTGVDTFIRIR